jgi:hypothetical protein
MATPERDGFAFVLAACTATAVAMSHDTTTSTAGKPPYTAR